MRISDWSSDVCSSDLFLGKTDAARALDAPRHHRLDDRPHVFFGDRALVLLEARMAAAIGHRLILQIALAALIADRAIERMVDQQEFHHAFARGLDHRRGGEDFLRSEEHTSELQSLMRISYSVF